MPNLEAPNPQASLIKQSRWLFEQEDYDGAVTGFATLVEQDPQNAEHLAWLARCYSAKKDDNKAFELANKAIELDSKQGMAYFVRGMSYKGLKKIPEAIKDFETAIELNPNFERPYNWLASEYLDQKLYAKTIELASKSIEINPKGIWPWSMRAMSHLQLGHYEGYLIDAAHMFELMNKEFSKADPVEGIDFFGIVNAHFKEKLAPQLAQTGEHFVESMAGAFTWGANTETRIRNGYSYTYRYGTNGAGYLCLTDQGLYVVSLGALARLFKKGGVGGFLLGALTQTIDNTETEKSDKIFKVPYSSISSARLVKTGKDEQLEIRSSELDVDCVVNDMPVVVAAITMGEKGKLAEIWHPTPKNPQVSEDIFAAIQRLSDLKNSGAITNDEFENKKKELLARL